MFFIAQAAFVWPANDRLLSEVGDGTRCNTLATVALSQLTVLAQQIRRYEKGCIVYVSNEARCTA